MGNWFLSNGKNIDLSQLKAGMHINSDNELLKKYDKDKNSIFDADELGEFKSDLAKFAGEDMQISQEEGIGWVASAMNIAKEKAGEFFNKQNIVDTALQELVVIQAQQDAASYIEQEALKAKEMYFQAQGGEVSKEWDSYKNLANHFITDIKNAGSRVYRKLSQKQMTGKLLSIAGNEGLSRSDYIRMKIGFLIELLGINGMNPKERQDIEDSIMDMELGEIDSTISKLCDASDEEFPNLLNAQKKELLESSQPNDNNVHSDLIRRKMPKFNSARILLEDVSTEQKISYEQIYKKEVGTEFYPEAVNDYLKKEMQAQYIAMVNNAIAPLNQKLTQSIKSLSDVQKYGGRSDEYETFRKRLETDLMSILKEMFSNDTDKINEFLEKFGAELILEETNPLNTKIQGGDLLEIAKNIKNGFDARLQSVLHGRSIEDVSNELENAHKLAFGENLNDVVSDYAKSQQEGVVYAKFGVMGLGMSTMFVSGGSLLAIGSGMLISTGGSISISALEASTKQGGMTEEDKIAIKKELKMALTFIPVGFGIGGVSSKLATLVASKFAFVTQYGSDLVMSCLADMAIMGETNLTSEGVAELMNIIMGITAHQKVKTHMNKANTGYESPVHLRNNPNNSADKQTKTIKVSPAENGNGLIVKIGNEEFLASNFDELSAIIKEKGGDANNIDFSDLKLSDDICAGASNEGMNGFFDRVKIWFDNISLPLNHDDSYEPYVKKDSKGNVISKSYFDDNKKVYKIVHYEKGKKIVIYERPKKDKYQLTEIDKLIIKKLENKYGYTPARAAYEIKSPKNVRKKYDGAEIDRLIRNLHQSNEKVGCKIAKFLAEDMNREGHTPLDLAAFNNYIESIDFNNLYKLAPDLRVAQAENILEFYKYHYYRGTKEFTVDNLKLNEDFTNYLGKHYVDADGMQKLMTVFPCTKRDIGSLPPGWTTNLDNSNIKEQVNNIIEEFRKKACTIREDVKKNSDPAILSSVEKTKLAIASRSNILASSFAYALSNVLKKQSMVTYLGSGAFGAGYKIEVAGANPVVLKIFHRTPDFESPKHGQFIETQAGVFINENSDAFVPLVFGRVSIKRHPDGFLVTEYVEGKNSGNWENTNLSNNDRIGIYTDDAWGDHNVVNDYVMDYGDVYVVYKDK